MILLVNRTTGARMEEFNTWEKVKDWFLENKKWEIRGSYFHPTEDKVYLYIDWR